MFTGADIAIYAAVLLGYIAMLALTERSAANYVSGRTKVAQRSEVFVVGGEPSPVAQKSAQPVARPARVPAEEM
ncbi:MAG: hypothetical protein Kow0056_08660 [Coriobacteriia bacterium]